MATATSAPVRIGFLVFPDVTQLDFTGPLQVLSRVPGAELHLVWKTLEPVSSDTVLRTPPTTTFDACPDLDVICVPGGAGTDALLNDAETLAFVSRQATQARYVTSVCTGSLVLGAAGLLQGYRATSHWSARDLLSHFGAIPTQARVVIDRNRITGGGVTAGIDFGLRLAEEIAGRGMAEAIQLMLEYDPAPPFQSGSPDKASSETLARLQTRLDTTQPARRGAVARAAERLGS